MDFKTYYLSLDETQRKTFARRARTTTDYLRVHLINAKKIPRPSLMIRLAKAWGKPVEELRQFFYENYRNQEKAKRGKRNDGSES